MGKTSWGARTERDRRQARDVAKKGGIPHNEARESDLWKWILACHCFVLRNEL